MHFDKTSLILHYLLKKGTSQDAIWQFIQDEQWDSVSEVDLDEAWEELHYFAHQRIFPIHFLDTNFPKGIAELPPSYQPALLYGMGDASCLNATSKVAYFGTPPIASDSFDAVQEHVRQSISANNMVCGLAFDGFDSVIHKICSESKSPSILINPCGLAHAKYSFRPQMVASLNCGAYVCSSIGMFERWTDATELASAYFTAALADILVFCDIKKDSPLQETLEWAEKNNKKILQF